MSQDEWPIVLTLYESSDGLQRVSRVTPHGEEVVANLPVELTTVCSLLYRALVKGGPPTGGTDALQQLARIAEQLAALELYIKQHMMTGALVKSWLEEWIPKLTEEPGASVFAPPPGQ